MFNEQITHSGNPLLGAHIAHCTLKTDSRGSRIVKESRRSTRTIDAAVAAVMAHDRARWHAAQPRGQVFFLENFP